MSLPPDRGESGGWEGHDATWARVSDLYELAHDLSSRKRAAFLDLHCKDSDLRREVEDLLDLEEAAHAHFSRLANRLSRRLDTLDAPTPTRSELTGRHLGAYRLLEEIGRGGMGVVHLAESTDGARSEPVAIKLLLVELAGLQGYRRFRRERQILARLRHPSIACLLDGGITASRRPFIVMEYVDGLPIDLWCDAAALTIEDRIALFLDVCGTVEYAHQNHVVHCDLKPSNVLVTGGSEMGSFGRVQLLDFGIARRLDRDPPGQERDRFHRIPLTPGWASPEQLASKPITPATDVYALTALLYRLLVGVPPHDFRGLTLEDIRHKVIHDHISPPVQRLHEIDPELQLNLAVCRRSRPAKLIRRLRGDLSRVLRKGLARHSELRYESPGALATDLRSAI